jgi:hypothetical protein
MHFLRREQHKGLQEEMRKLRAEMIVVRKENEESTKRAALAQLKLTVRSLWFSSIDFVPIYI